MFNDKYWSKTIAISNYKVMESAAGFYIGRSSVELNSYGDRYPAPYDRASGYYPTEEAAKKDLPKYKEINNE